MKVKSMLLLAGMAVAISAGAQMPDWGVADTIEYYPVGPGAVYARIEFKKKPLHVFQTTIDLNDLYNSIELYPSNKRTPDARRETTTSQCRNNTYSGHRVFCGVNHDLFHYSYQTTAAGINARNGEIVSHYGNWGRSVMSISKEKVAEVFPPNFVASVLFGDETRLTIDNINESAFGVQGVRNCVLFNTYCALNLTEVGTYVLLEPQGEWIINGESTPCKIKRITSDVIQPDGKSHILFLRREAETLFKSKAKEGDEIHISQDFIDGRFPNSGLYVPPAKNILQAFHGWPSVILNGQLHDKEYNDFVEPGRENWDYPCTLVGITKDGKKLFVITVDKATMMEIAYYLVSQGAWNVVNFDGGGSATMAINGELVNTPTDGKEREVMDTFQGISLAPESNEISSITFSRPSIQAIPLAAVSLRLLSHNKYGDILDGDLKNVEFICPEELGSVDRNGVFLAGESESSGIIQAFKDGKRCELFVNILSSENPVKVVPENVLIDNIREYPIQMTSVYGNKVYTINPAAFDWVVSNPSCCTVSGGVVKGVSNGESVLTGTCGDIVVTLHVKVEIGKNEIICENFANMSGYPVKTTSAVTNLHFENTNLPVGWTDGCNLVFDLGVGRAPYIDMNKPVTFFGLPDSISIQLKPSAGFIKNISITFSSNLKKDFLFYEIVPENEKDSLYIIHFESVEGVSYDVPMFPIVLESLKFNIDQQRQGKDLKIAMRELKAFYPQKDDSGVGNILKNELRTYVDANGNLVLSIPENIKESVKIEIFNLEGQLVFSDKRVADNFVWTIPVVDYTPGIYIVRVQTTDEIRVSKFPLK